MKGARVLSTLLVLLLAIISVACGEVPEPGGMLPASEMTTTEIATLLPAPAAQSSPSAIPVLSTPAPEQAGLTIFSGLDTSSIGTTAFDPGNPEVMYVGTYNGLFRSTDGGNSWYLLSTELRNSQQILIDPASPQVLYARRFGVQGEENAWQETPGIYKSTDGGVSWQVKEEGTGGKRIFSIALVPSSPVMLYAGSFGGMIFKSTDTGETWAETGESRPAQREIFPGRRSRR